MKFHLVLALLLVLATPLSAEQQQDPSAMEQDLLRMVNQERAKAGVPALRLDPMLVDAARAHSRLMAQRKTLSHRLEGEPDLSQRVAATRLRFNAVAENVSSAQGSDESTPAEVAHGGLMDSPGHRANILNPDYNSIGIGVARQGSVYYTTEDFAKAYAAVDSKDVERIVAGKVNEIRRRHSLPALRSVPLDRLAAIACRDTTSVQTLLQNIPSARTALIFTTWTPEELPARIVELAEESGVNTISLHACSMPPAHGGSGGFKVAAVFF
jgi:uncharacterized protein YkwD